MLLQFFLIKEQIRCIKFPKLLDKSAFTLFAIDSREKSPSFPKGTSLNKKNRI